MELYRLEHIAVYKIVLQVQCQRQILKERRFPHEQTQPCLEMPAKVQRSKTELFLPKPLWQLPQRHPHSFNAKGPHNGLMCIAGM